MQFLERVGLDDDAGRERIQRRLQDFVRALRHTMKESDPDPDTAKQVAKIALDFVSIPTVRQAFVSYQRQLDFDRVWEGFQLLIAESATDAGGWSDVLDRFEGLDQVTLMTIHKSKGLEFHTMIFYGLDNQTWWSLTPGNTEELNSFFVALTRAEQRAFFTLCRSRGQPVTWIENLLAPAGVHRIDGNTLLAED